MRLRVNTGLFVTVGESFGESRSTSALVQQSCFGTAVCVGCAKTSMEAMSVRGDTSMIGQFGVFRFGQGSCGEQERTTTLNSTSGNWRQVDLSPCRHRDCSWGGQARHEDQATHPVSRPCPWWQRRWHQTLGGEEFAELLLRPAGYESGV